MKMFWCFFFGHKYRLAQEFNDWSRRAVCTRCGKSFAMNDDCRSIIDWDSEFHRMYERHGHKIQYQQWEFK